MDFDGDGKYGKETNLRKRSSGIIGGHRYLHVINRLGYRRLSPMLQMAIRVKVTCG